MIPLIPSSADESCEEVVSFRELKGKGTAVVAVDDPVKKLDAVKPPEAVKPVEAVKFPKAIAVPTNLPQGNDARHEFFDRMFRAVENLTPVDDVRVATFMASVVVPCSDLARFPIERQGLKWDKLKHLLRERFISGWLNDSDTVLKQLYKLAPKPGHYQDFWYELLEVANRSSTTIEEPRLVKIAVQSIMHINQGLGRTLNAVRCTTSEALLEHLRDEDAMPVTSAATALVVSEAVAPERHTQSWREQRARSEPRSAPRPPPICHQCERVGHIKKYCPFTLEPAKDVKLPTARVPQRGAMPARTEAATVNLATENKGTAAPQGGAGSTQQSKKV